MDKIILKCNNLCKRYYEGSTQTDVLLNINLSIKESEMVAITGKSGSGKSTLLHLLYGLDTPTSGDIIFFENKINKMSSFDKAEMRNRKLGFIYQFHHLLSDFTVLENVAMPLLIAKNKIKEIKFHVKNMLKIVGLENRENYHPSKLSGGERQRVAIARALINNPILVLADEPTGSLDNDNVNNIFQLLNEFNKRKGTAFLIATHDLYLANHMHRQLEISHGQLNTKLK